MEVVVGQKYKIKKYKVIPPRWNQDGDMNHWMGKIVTIKYIMVGPTDERLVRIKEDDGHWVWREQDFEPIYMEIVVGKKYRIKTYDLDPIPQHWNANGEMNNWMGEIVTIRYVSLYDIHAGFTDKSVRIVEDKNRWSWRESDFEPIVGAWDEKWIGK